MPTNTLQVFTVFSTSKDHGQGKGATCGCILVDFHRLLVINRSAKYRNKYVHRRDSMSLANLTLQELQAQVDLGLVVQPDSEDDEVKLELSLNGHEENIPCLAFTSPRS